MVFRLTFSGVTDQGEDEMKRGLNFGQYFGQLLDTANADTWCEIDSRNLASILKPTPDFWNAFAIRGSEQNLTDLWYVFAEPYSTDEAQAVLPNGKVLRFKTQTLNGRLFTTTFGGHSEFVPLVLWEGSSQVFRRAIVVEFDKGFGVVSNQGRRLAAADTKKNLEWTAKGVIADCGFVVRQRHKRRRYLEATFYVKRSLSHLSRAELHLLDKNGRLVERLNSDFMESANEQVFRETTLNRLSDGHEVIVRSLSEDDVLPLCCNASFALPNDLTDVKRVKLVVSTSLNVQLSRTDGVRPAAFGNDPDGEFSAVRGKQQFSLGSNEAVRQGFLLTVAQRKEASTRILQQSFIEERLRDDFDGHATAAAQNVQRALDSGTACSLISRDDEAIHRYYDRMVKKSFQQYWREEKIARKGHITNSLDAFHAVESDIAGESVRMMRDNCRSEISDSLIDSMRDRNLTEYEDLVELARNVVNDNVETEWHRELCGLILSDSMTIPQAAMHLGRDYGAARTAFCRILSILRNRFVEMDR